MLQHETFLKKNEGTSELHLPVGTWGWLRGYLVLWNNFPIPLESKHIFLCSLIPNIVLFLFPRNLVFVPLLPWHKCHANHWQSLETCVCNSSFKLKPIFSKLCRCLWHGLKKCIWVSNNHQNICVTFVPCCELRDIIFRTWILSTKTGLRYLYNFIWSFIHIDQKFCWSFRHVFFI